ncbi:acyl-CoA thioesterase [Nocardia panacis]|uniref:Acyl-CoA thioesterase n=1 Tax=Nocardia panacis TaxID=2340916 RepID=A0A3A4KR06_9NOCA|nr:thioesterase family protein [Nocardia panacis]RJO72307.1 acyl-CoA thioesterase [Nocardia panacis]
MSAAGAGCDIVGRVTQQQYPVLWPVQTRWADNDHYGHVNNVVYYSYFDSAVNGWLMEATGTDIRTLPAIGVVAQTSCRFLASLSFPDRIRVGLRVTRLGRSSITYDLAIFREDGASLELAATGDFVHVYVNADTRKPVEIPAAIREAATTLAGPVKSDSAE